jgi:hypothetical protein
MEYVGIESARIPAHVGIEPVGGDAESILTCWPEGAEIHSRYWDGKRFEVGCSWELRKVHAAALYAWGVPQNHVRPVTTQVVEAAIARRDYYCRRPLEEFVDIVERCYAYIWQLRDGKGFGEWLIKMKQGKGRRDLYFHTGLIDAFENMLDYEIPMIWLWNVLAAIKGGMMFELSFDKSLAYAELYTGRRLKIRNVQYIRDKYIAKKALVFFERGNHKRRKDGAHDPKKRPTADSYFLCHLDDWLEGKKIRQSEIEKRRGFPPLSGRLLRGLTPGAQPLREGGEDT